MSSERVILCGGLRAPVGTAGKTIVPLLLWGRDANVTLKITGISRKLVADIHPLLVDLLEIASYVYCADQATTRGGDTSKNYSARWRRRFQFHIPVREPEVWSSDAVITALRDTLGFLSDEEYEFVFEKLSVPHPMAEYLDFEAGGTGGFKPDEVILFSGGIDSLGGAIQESLSGKTIALISQRSSAKISNRQQELLQDLSSAPGAATTVPVNPDSGSEPGKALRAPIDDGSVTRAYFDLRGATFFGYDEFAKRVAEAQAQNARRAGIWAVA